jgi:hypothetical protein
MALAEALKNALLPFVMVREWIPMYVLAYVLLFTSAMFAVGCSHKLIRLILILYAAFEVSLTWHDGLSLPNDIAQGSGFYF